MPFSSFKNLTCAATDTNMITDARHSVYSILDGHAIWNFHELALRHIQCLFLFAICGLHFINEKCPKLTHLGEKFIDENQR